MSTRHFGMALVGVALLAAGGYGLYRVGLNQGMQMASDVPAAIAGAGMANAGKDTTAPGKKVLYWHDPMVPGQKFDKPGKSPFMDMQLVPVYADEHGVDGTVSISARTQQNLGVRTAAVAKGSLETTFGAVGSVAYNDRDVAVVQARANGFVEKLFVRAPLDPVRKGQPLAELFVPDWVAAQEEYLAARRLSGVGLESLADAARQRMQLAGMNEAQIRAFESTGEVQGHTTLQAPIGGVIAELGAREGMTVMAGAPLFRINGLSTVWINADIPEGVAAQVRPGTAVEARTPALPGDVFKGKVSAILPEVNPATRTIKARIELANKSGRLVPGMFATVSFTAPARSEVLLVPTEAVIQTGKRNVVIVAQGDGQFAPVDVELGTETGGQTEIRKGLEAGQKVVVSGQFLVDSEASLRSTAARMGDAPIADKPAGKSSETTHHGEGKVEMIGKDEITLSHGPIPTLQWGPMTMGFKMPPAGLPKDIRVGDRVAFAIHPTQDGAFQITSITPAWSNAGSTGSVKSGVKSGAPK